MKIKLSKKFFSLLLIVAGIFVFRLVFAQDFGTDAVNSGLNGALAGGDPRAMVGRIINVALGFLGVIALGLVIYAGFLWMTSNGEEDKISRAKQILVSASIGLLIILASWAIATFVINKLNGAINGNGGPSTYCTNGQISSCGCGGSMACSNNVWGGCVGSDCSINPSPTSCDGSANPGCQAENNICAPSDYCDNSCTCQPKASAGESCDADVSNATCDADNNMCAQYLSCDTTTCTCFGPPVITEISPLGGFCNENINKACASDTDCDTTCDIITPNGAADNFITISGKNFGEYSATDSRVIFMGGAVNGRSPSEINPVCVNFWQDDQIIIAVPAGASTGPIKVITKDTTEDVTNDDYGPKIPDFIANNIKRPGLCLISPNQGGLSSAVSYQGINLYSGQAYFGNYQSNVQGLDSNFSHPSGLSGTAATPNIRSGVSGSFVINNISGNQEKSNYLKFVKEADPNDGPFIVSFSPTQGSAGQYVTINGSGFGGAQGNSHVYFGNMEAAYNFPAVCASSVWSDKQVVVKVPDSLTNGNYLIRMSIGGKTIDSQTLNPNIFRADNAISLKTSLCKLEPKKGGVATPVKVYGEYFGQAGRDALVQFSSSKDVYGTIAQNNGADIVSVNVPAAAITGPVKVVKNNEWGNELNFEVGSCTSDAECPGQVCCPGNTYKKGICAADLMSCLINIPNSVFEWNFDTGFSNIDTDSTESCSTLASYYGACQVNSACPNVPGACSPFAGGTKKNVATCDFSCASVTGCGAFGSSTCSYDASINKCVKDGSSGSCNLPLKQTFNINGNDVDLNLTCNQAGNWEIKTNTSCPDGWIRGSNNICVNTASSCSACVSGLSCEALNSSSSMGSCVSNTICPSGSTCEDNPDISKPDSCVAIEEASCDCCCRIEKSAQDCCAPLACTGTCGQDTSDDGAGFGSCSGCANVGTTVAEHDAACNCTGHSGQYCSITPENPSGICTDCSGLIGLSSCSEHNAACCFDANRTPLAGDDFCRGGSGTAITNNPADADFGYCGYYSCFNESTPPVGDPATCASANPFKIGAYKSVSACTDGCAANPGKDFCSLFDGNKDECSAATSCCFDSQSALCKSGTQISSGNDAGYCAYYDCQTDVNGVSTCDINPKTAGAFNDLTTCSARCGGTEGGVGKDCVAPEAAATCNFGLCNFPSFSCLNESGNTASDISDCGACCCNPADTNACKTESAPGLYCQPDKGNCSGASRGLCCGCKNDGECGNSNLVGCGLDTCCDSRPEAINSVPASGTNNVCRNSVVKVYFNKQMDISSFNANVVLMEEMNYGGSVCPSGTFVYEGDSGFVAVNNNWFVKIFKQAGVYISRLFGDFNNQALADLPDKNKLYCSVPGSASGEYSGEETVLTFAPGRLMTPDAKYFLIVKGDEELNSQSGVISLSGIGLNGQGLEGVEGAVLSFNNKNYKNSYIVQFKTLSDKGSNSGVCAISKVKLAPDSYLFNTAENSLDENDTNLQDKTFDTKRDKDKVFKALAYSSDDQIIQPVTGYFWEWKFALSDPSVASMASIASDRVLVTAKEGITDGETKLSATVDMVRFLNSSSSIDANCACTNDTCTSNCRNAFSVGDNLSGNANIYVFICANPWPPVSTNGTWYPWSDNCTGAIGTCNNFNYKFYYCRDAGGIGTADDLPAIMDKAVIRGQSATLVCSSDNSSCAGLNSACGADKNGDGRPDGICIWNVLKESYFFRETVLSSEAINSISDNRVGGEVSVMWTSSSPEAASYKVYYGESGKAITGFQEFKRSDVCQLSGGVYNCLAKVSGLQNDKTYSFRLSVLSASKSESTLSNEMSGTPTDQTPTGAPDKLNVRIQNSKFIFSWEDSNSENKFYRLYHGVYPSRYGESFDSGMQSKSLEFSLDRFGLGDHYFAVASVDENGNESAKSLELNFVKEACDSSPTGCFKFITFESILTNVDFEQTTSTGLPQDWSISQQKYSSVKISTAEHLSGNQSALLHQDQGHPYPGTCNAAVCASGICTWNAAAKTCSFSAKDDCHATAPAIYSEGQTLCWGNSNRVMWTRLAYNLAKLDLRQGDKYSISFYYKGNNAGNVNVSMSPSLGWSTQCVHYSSANVLKNGYSWIGGKVVPTPPVGTDPCNTAYGATCSGQINYCCVQAPVQTACYSAITMPTIPINSYDNWTWYYYSFEYKDQMASWLDRNGNKLIEMGLSMGYNSTVNRGSDFYVDDLIVRKITSGVEIKY